MWVSLMSGKDWAQTWNGIEEVTLFNSNSKLRGVSQLYCAERLVLSDFDEKRGTSLFNNWEFQASGTRDAQAYNEIREISKKQK